MEAKTHTPTLKESTIVERVARIVSSVRGIKPDYTRLAAELEPAIPFDIFGVVLLRHDRQAVRVTICRKENNSWIAQHHQHPLEGSMVERVLKFPVTVVKNYTHGLDGLPAQCGDALSGYHQLRTTLIAPLIAGDWVLGTLELGSTNFGVYADETLQRLIEAVVRVLAAAIESAQVGGSAEIQDRQRQALKDVSSALTSKMDLSSILNQIVDGIAQALNVASAIVTFDQREGKPRLESQSGLDSAQLHGLVSQKGAMSSQSIIGYTLRRSQPCVSHDISTDERFPESCSFATALGMRSIFSYPLVTGTTIYGALLLCSPEPGGFTPLKADILSLFASQATIAIHNGMLIESAHQRTRFQQAIEQLERTYAQNVDERELLEHVRRESERTFGISFSSLLHFISDHLLTRSERDLHAILHSSSQELPLNRYSEEDHLAPPASVEETLSAPPAQEENDNSLIFLTQTADAALARAEVLSELSRLFTQTSREDSVGGTGSGVAGGNKNVPFSLAESQTSGVAEGNKGLKQSIEHIKAAWFVVDLHGLCIYMNPAAEVFCGIHMGTFAESSIEDIFAELLPRIRNIEEVCTYLHDFDLTWGAGDQENAYQKELRCVLAAEPIHLFNASSPLPAAQSPGRGSHLKGVHASRSSLIQDYAPSDQYYQLTRYPLFNQQGTLIANVLQIYDVTAQVRDEKNKSTLLSSVSHDLRTPLTTIKAAVTGLLQIDVEWDVQTRREILEEIDAEADHLGVLVNALIEMSRIEMGALVLDKEWCDIVEVVYGALRRLERVLAGRPIRTEFQPHLPLNFVDHLQLERVFYNLVEHVVRNNPGDAELLVSVDCVDEGAVDLAEASHHYLRARVIDRARGVPAAEHERIFKTFYGLNLRGSGLGLAIARGIVEAHQGQIGVESEPNGDGLCYVFTLPLHSYDGRPSSSRQESNTASFQAPSIKKTEFIASTVEEQS
jgi:signal transduction histidine kinase/GAF domain-containing protein